MSRNTQIRLVIILAVTLVCIYGIIGLPTSKAQLAANWKNNIRLGTDLQGGSNLVAISWGSENTKRFHSSGTRS